MASKYVFATSQHRRGVLPSWSEYVTLRHVTVEWAVLIEQMLHVEDMHGDCILDAVLDVTMSFRCASEPLDSWLRVYAYFEWFYKGVNRTFALRSSPQVNTTDGRGVVKLAITTSSLDKEWRLLLWTFCCVLGLEHKVTLPHKTFHVCGYVSFWKRWRSAVKFGLIDYHRNVVSSHIHFKTFICSLWMSVFSPEKDDVVVKLFKNGLIVCNCLGLLFWLLIHVTILQTGFQMQWSGMLYIGTRRVVSRFVVLPRHLIWCCVNDRR